MRHHTLARSLAAPVIVPALAAALAGCGYSEPLPAVPAAPLNAAPALHALLPQDIKDAGVLVFAADSHPPYRTVGPDGAITGIDKDIQDALSRVLGVRIEMEQCRRPARGAGRHARPTGSTRSTARSRPPPSGRSSSTRSPG